MSTAVHPESLVRRPFRLPAWGVTAIALISLVVGVAGGIVVGNSLAEETAPATTKAVPATIVVPEGAAERPWPAAYPITKPGLAETSDHASDGTVDSTAFYRDIKARPPVKSS